MRRMYLCERIECTSKCIPKTHSICSPSVTCGAYVRCKYATREPAHTFGARSCIKKPVSQHKRSTTRQAHKFWRKCYSQCWFMSPLRAQRIPIFTLVAFQHARLRLLCNSTIVCINHVVDRRSTARCARIYDSIISWQSWKFDWFDCHHEEYPLTRLHTLLYIIEFRLLNTPL